tara:strand:+ start:179 stop:388 length:210 start_codon:yes stop_codon:yes gene_type:complete
MTKIPISFENDSSIQKIYEMKDWCTDHFGPCIMAGDRWIGGVWCLDLFDGTFTFTQSKDALIFTLKWII